jgi:hypothetical protein
LLVLVSLASGGRKPKRPRCLVFDNSAAMFRVSDRDWDPQAYALAALDLPGYAYAQLSGFRLRSYTSSSSSSGNSSSRSTTHWVVCLLKADGGLWDLHDTISKADADSFLARIQSAVDLAAGRGQPQPDPVLPERIRRVPVAGTTLYCWRNPSRFLGLFLGLAFMAFFVYFMVKIAADALPFLIFAGLVVAFITLVLVKGVWEGIISVRYWRCVRITGDTIHAGLVPKSLLPLVGSPEDQGFVPDSAAIDAAFKSRQRLDIRLLTRVQYSWRTADRQAASQELLLMTEAAAAGSDNLTTGNIRWSTLLKTASAMREGIMHLSLDGLSVGETMAFERILEQEITRRGGKAD